MYLTDSWDHMYTTRNISPTNNQANIVELHPACVYSIRMYSYNKIGRSLPSKELTISTEEACKWLFSLLTITLFSFLFYFFFLWIIVIESETFSINSAWRAAYGCNPPTNDVPEHKSYMEGKVTIVITLHINVFYYSHVLVPFTHKFYYYILRFDVHLISYYDYILFQSPKKELQNGVIRGYQIGYRENGPGSNGQYSIVEMKATGDSEVYTLDNLKKFAQYGVVVQAFNRAGTGPSSTEINATTLEDGKKKDSRLLVK